MAISVSDLEQRVRRGDDLSGVDLRGMDLSGAQLAGAKLQRADLTGAKLLGVNLSGAQLARANFTEAFALRAVLSNASLDKAELDDCILRQADLRQANLQRASLEGANLEEARLDGATLTYAQLDSANLTSTNLTGADLRGADLSYACLALAKLERVRAEQANLSFALLDGADLSHANFSGASLLGTSLEQAELHQASFRGCHSQEPLSPLLPKPAPSEALADGHHGLLSTSARNRRDEQPRPAERYFGPGDLLRNAELHFEPAAVVRVDGRFESCSLHLRSGARLLIGPGGLLLDCIVFGGAVKVSGCFSSASNDGLVHTEELSIDARASVATRLVQPTSATRFELARGCRVRLQIAEPPSAVESARSNSAAF